MPTQNIRTPMLWFCMLALLLSVSWSSRSQAKSGMYIGLGIGGAVVSGDDGFALKADRLGQIPPSGLVTTDYASGLGLLFRLGYNILGVVAIEAALTGNAGNFSEDLEGQGHFHGAVVVHPVGILNLAGVTDEHMWDPYILVGGGFSYGMYSRPAGEDKGWFAADLATGVGLNAHVLPFMSVGLDLRIIVPFHKRWIFNFDDDITFDVDGTRRSIVVQPTVNATFHLF